MTDELIISFLESVHHRSSTIFPYPPRKMLLVGDFSPPMDGPRHPDVKYVLRVEDIGCHCGNGLRSDGILVAAATWTLPVFITTLSQLAQILEDNGRIFFLFKTSHDLPCDPAQLDQQLSDLGLIKYFSGQSHDGPDGIPSWGFVAVRSSYNPIMHARRMAASGRPDFAIDIIDAIPQDLVLDTSLLAGLALEKQQHYFSWQKHRSHIDPPHTLFSKARREFAQVTALDPHMVDAYRIHAQYWAYLGRPDMARRVSRSIGHIFPHTAIEDFSGAKPLNTTNPKKDKPTPLWDPRNQPVRILILTHDHSDYGMDTLYHGLCALLGEKNVVEYPWKPTLHGQNIELANNYPCVFNYAGDPTTVEYLEEELREGKFDLILYGDVVQMAHGDDVKRLVQAGADIPLVLYDTWDDCYTPLQQILEYIGRPRFDVMFKREMLDGVDYDEQTFPLPFGYAENFVLPKPKTSTGDTIFWAGKNEYGLRPLYIQMLEKKLGYPLNRRYDQSTYQSKLANSQMGLSFFGCGFDSVRYWELPANGVMLMAERPPIRIPHNFVDDQSAVFFDDLQEMESKLEYYTRNPEAVARIAAAGHAHYLKHHTTQMRARQILGIIDHALCGRLTRAKVPVVSSDDSVLRQMDNRPSKLYLGLVRGKNYGWGVCSQYLIKELSKLQAVHVLNEKDGSAHNGHLGGPVFQALTTVDFPPLYEQARGTRNYGYTFFENELTPTSIENAKQYDLVLAGSTWCRDRLLEKNISNCDVLIQGVDPKHFYPIEDKKQHDRFVIFSGGKFELRKGQDILIRAVKILQDKYPDVYLVNCWYNMWPASVRQMVGSPYINFTYNENASWQETMQRTYRDNGLDLQRVFTLDPIPHQNQRALFEQTDIGVFPNRCEGGTNLVLMEYMACAKPVIASYTSGHKDILTEKNALLLRHLKNINIVDDDGALIGRWQDPSIDELVAHLEHAYLHRDAYQSLSRQAGIDLQQFSWKRSAERLARFLTP